MVYGKGLGKDGEVDMHRWEDGGDSGGVGQRTEN